MAVDNRGYQEKTNGKTGSILNADGNASPVTMPSNGKLKFATLGKMDMQKTAKVPIVFGTDIAKSSSALTLSKRIVI